MTVQKTKLRCAVYARKSSEEGLEQEFNSLDAQREACEAYIASQRHEGWRVSATRYHDGGVSGGTLDRPALKRLLRDIEAGQVKMVVVYKIDRLTRSLADFAKLVELFDKAGCSFVSVTQAFNTSSSMGRLTLNVLLSFAQFEREVTAERIRDKIAASKRKGMWMGGLVPLGYRLTGPAGRRRLEVDEREAEHVRLIFSSYEREGCLEKARKAAEAAGIVSKARRFKSGKTCGGKPLTRGQVHYVLRNPIYAGRVRHRDKTYEGEHDAIIDRDRFEKVQTKLRARARRPPAGSIPTGDRSPLCGRLFDEKSDRLTPTHASGRNRRKHRYYVSNRLLAGRDDPSGWRLPALQLENVVSGSVEGRLRQAVSSGSLFAEVDAGSIRNADSLRFDTSTCLSLIRRVDIQPGELLIQLCPDAVAAWLGLKGEGLDQGRLHFASRFQMRRRGVETRIITKTSAAEIDPVLIRALARAHDWVDRIKSGEPASAIALKENTSDAYVRVRANLAFLSPRIQKAITEGRQPPDLTLERLVREGIPLEWSDQERKFGF